jgi:hypothetical protein
MSDREIKEFTASLLKSLNDIGSLQGQNLIQSEDYQKKVIVPRGNVLHKDGRDARSQSQQRELMQGKQDEIDEDSLQNIIDKQTDEVLEIIYREFE